jgi:membrane protein DedA with SNARE-associated domain
MLKSAAIAAAGSGLGVFDRLTEWATDHGYFAILAIVAGDGVFPLFPGETVIVAGGTLAATGDLALLGVILAGTLGAVIGDSTAYWLGRAGGEGIRRYLARLAGHDRVVAAERMVARRGPALVFVGRFLPGIRLAINLSCGAGQMDYRRFIIFDSLGALLWATQAAVLGYIFGKRFEDRPWIGLLIALGVALAVAGIVTMRERKHIRHEKEQADAELARREAQDSTVSP